MLDKNRVWTRSIILEEITVEEFTELEEQWGYCMPKDRLKTYASMSNPVMAETYRELVKRFKDHPFGERLNIRKGKEWLRIPRENITPEVMGEIERIASRDVLETNHFEMRFHAPRDYLVEAAAEIEFGRKGNLIIGYKVHFHRAHDLLFDCQFVYPQLFIEAVWDREMGQY